METFSGVITTGYDFFSVSFLGLICLSLVTTTSHTYGECGEGGGVAITFHRLQPCTVCIDESFQD